ncbi:MAG TPA: LptF/LptG family permease [Bryobacteraceae bacterium]|nr:LptF/LptG family permease [Bryobacteraceae bacterium]
MGVLGRRILRDIASSALLGIALFTFVLFLDRVRPLFELLVRSSAPPKTIAWLFSLLLPPAFTFTIPVGVLVAVLLTMSRMSGDSEVTAMRAAGLSSRRVLLPVMTISTVALLLTAAASVWLTPWSIRQRYKVVNQLAAAQLTAEIQPRIFEERFPNRILYVGDVVAGQVVRWRNVFLADITPPDKRPPGSGTHEPGDGPLITVAAEAIAVPDLGRNRIQLSLIRGALHYSGKLPADYYSSSFPVGDQILEADRPAAYRPRLQFTEMDTGPLLRAVRETRGRDAINARIELHQRLALPLACVLLGLAGVPLGVSSRKGGRSSAFVLTVLIALVYYMTLISLIGLAREGRVPPGVAVWLPNMVLAFAAAVLLWRMEAPGDLDPIGAVRLRIGALVGRLRGRLRTAPAAARAGLTKSLPLVPALVDTYVLSSFIYYFCVLLVSFVLMTHVFTFFDLLGDIVKNHIPMSLVATYLLFLTPQLIYVLTPISVLVGVLVTFGILTKSNEVTAMKACGVSLYRLSVPVLLTSCLLSALLFAFDYTWIPRANVIQDGIRNQIKGRPAQTYLRPDRRWIFGRGSRIYNYKYFEAAENVMLGVNVFELDPQTFRLKRHISAERARWEASLNSWVFQNGWARELTDDRITNSQAFEREAASFRGLDEPPSWFLKEVKQDKQMNPPELAAYIDELRQSGFDTVRLQVQLHRKFSLPLFAAIMALLSVPFAFLVGTRGAIAGVGISFGIAVAYWAVSQLFEQVGYVNQLPPQLAAWAPDALFGLSGLYLLARMKT